jgi:hypothetical protein
VVGWARRRAAAAVVAKARARTTAVLQRRLRALELERRGGYMRLLRWISGGDISNKDRLAERFGWPKVEPGEREVNGSGRGGF